MSIWLRRRDEDGITHHISVPFEPMVPIFFVGLAGALALMSLATFCDAATESPVTVVVAILGLITVGATMFATAKISIISRCRVSFGARLMSPLMRCLYVGGYMLLLIGLSLGLLFVLLAYTL